jgi:peptidoglycan hydrolase CwlO-like protein
MGAPPKGKEPDKGKGKDAAADKKTKQAMDDMGDTIDDLESQVEKISKLQSQASKGGDTDKVGKQLETEIKKLKSLVDDLEKSSKSLKG